MTKRYEVHSMIAGMDIGDTMDLEVCKSLIEKYGSSRDIELFITDNGRDMTYGEVADKLNWYHKREELLKQLDTFDDMISLIEDEIDKKIELLTDAETECIQNDNKELYGKVKFSIQVLRELKEVFLNE